MPSRSHLPRILAAALTVATGLRAAGIAALWLALPAHAAHPLQTEDTGTQGGGNVELENGFSRTRDGHGVVATYQPQVSYGVSAPLDLIVQPLALIDRPRGAANMRGVGDTNLDAKWRFFGAAPWSLATRAGVLLPTGTHDLGLPHGTASLHALLVATADAAPLTLHANLGLTRNPASSGLSAHPVHVSAAALWAVDERLTLTADGGADSTRDADRHTRSGTLLAGAIYSVVPGLDVDVGFLHSLHAASPTRQWLAGLTYRFAP